jgi:3-dehydroquinate synthase
MTTVPIQIPTLPAATYDVQVAPNVLQSLGRQVRAVAPAPSCGLISDSNVAPLYLEVARRSLAAADYRVITHIIPAGEDHKNIHTAIAAMDTLLNAGIERATPVIALGGGVVGDLAGFVAASLLRGVPFIQVPTTLLAAVDASVGGKVGIDHPAGKNLIGAFHQPRLVLTDIATFCTLPQREIRCGLAECIKHAIIRDASLFQFIADHLPKILANHCAAVEELVTRNIRIKAAIVQEDPFEHGVRALLNLGHTFGHAIENVTDYRVQHGECVALGIITAARLSHARGTLPAQAVAQITSLIAAVGLPAALPQLDLQRTLALMTTDKKVRAGKIRFIIPTSIGTAKIIDDATPEQVHNALASLRNIQWP